MEKVSGQVSFPQLEEDVLRSWEKNRTFARSKEKRRGCEEYIFYDGPPFANGLPHHGHILANTIKDVVPRYWTMRGYHVDRRFGWDCHGLPVEYEIEKRENFKGRQDILQIGVERFNHMCRESVMHYAKEWQRTITRLGRWVEWDNQYRTMDLEFMESVWWVCKTLATKNLLYRDYKVVPYSPRITAVLSNFEANQNYKEIQDPAIVVKMKARDEDAFFLIWTTTPWTLVSNLALAVGKDIPYVRIKDKTSGENYYLAAARLDALYPQTDTYHLEEKLVGAELADRSYTPLYPYAKDKTSAFKIIVADFVTTTEGTGIVHMAPAFGEDDYRVCRKQGITIFDPLDDEGRFTAQTDEFSGLFVKDADKPIIKGLKARGLILRHDTIMHRYPFCERTDTPLIYRAVPAWYVAVEKIRDRLCAHNTKINWVPAHLQQGRVGNWLREARDWAISRNRFWGTPLPIWTCDRDCDGMIVVGSVAELERLSSERANDLHKHTVDKLQIPCQVCGAQMNRVPEVLDCWFESGSMPCAQNHYPFTQKTKPPPAHFIAEGLDQTRGWFYTLSVLATALFDQPAFLNVVVNGTILDEQGKKMSKRHRNYTPPDDLMHRYGSDSVRLYLLNSPLLRAEDLRFSDKGVVDTVRTMLLPLWNACSFLTTYAEADGWTPRLDLVNGGQVATDNKLDRWIISKLQTLSKEVHAHMEGYRLNQTVPKLVEFIDTLTNWYIRLNRRRFWGENTQIDDAAFSTLYYVLLNFCKILAPFAPFITDRIYQALTAGLQLTEDSVHLTDMPVFVAEQWQPQLETRLDLVKTVIELGRRARAQHKIKTRQVLARARVIATKDDIAEFSHLIKSELNVKDVDFSAAEEKYVDWQLKPDLKKLGPRLGNKLKTVRDKLAAINTSQTKIKKFWQTVLDDDCVIETVRLSRDDFMIERHPKANMRGKQTAIETAGGVTLLLDLELSPELVREGLAREVVNRIQKSRRECDLQVSDRIEIALLADADITAAVEACREYICRETLTTKLDFVPPKPAKYRYTESFAIDSYNFTLFIK